MDVKFVWYDSYTKEKKVTTNGATERLAMLYNLGVIYGQIVGSANNGLGKQPDGFC